VDIVSVGPAWGDAAVYEFDGLVEENNETDETEFTAQFNIRNDFNVGDNFAYTKFGVKYASKEKTTDLHVFEASDNPDSIANLSLVQDSTLGRNAHNQGPRADQQRIRDLYFSNKQAFIEEGGELFHPEDSNTGDYESTEDVLAAYGMGAISFGNATLTGGLRVERTEFETTGKNVILDEDGDFVSADPISEDKSYTDFFPHLSLQYNFNEDTIGRVAITKTIARPRFKQTALRRFVNREDEEIEAGNPQLDPFESWNFDASIEFYSPNLGVFSAAVFYKSIDNYVFDLATELEDADTGYDLITFLNGESAQIYGLEFNFRRELGAGFGVSANLTLSDSDAKTDLRPSDTLTFLKHSDTIGSLALYYENGGLNFRVAGSYRSGYIDEFGEETSEDRYVDDHFQIDLTASYDINEQWSVFAEVINLNDEPFRAYYDESFGLSQFEEYSWTASFGIKFNL
ncbi:MAG: TonB-dependent receptor, partial [Opitutales bacterium]|nr:TonB-dependent receptor [Opitutales bacterium]